MSGTQQNQQQNDQQQEGVKSEDLALVDDRLEDETKDDAALWEEIERAESGSGDTDTDDPPPDQGREDDDGGDRADAGGSDDQGAAGADDQPSGSEDQPDGNQPSGDVWANASPEQRAAWEAAQAELEKLTQYRRSTDGRIAAYQRQIAELTRQKPSDRTAEQGEQGQDAGRDADHGDSFLESNDWKAFQDEYPEVAKPLGGVISALQAKLDRQDRELAAIGDDRRQDALSEQAALLDKAVPDWKEVIADEDAFGAWVQTQPRHIREAAFRNAESIVDHEEAADVIGRFKAYRGEQGTGQQPSGDQNNGRQDTGNNQTLSAKRKRQLESSAAARSSGPGAAHGIPEDGDPEKLWEDFERMEKRQARG